MSKGHSYGGEGAAYVGTMSKMFAAIGMGAGVVDPYLKGAPAPKWLSDGVPYLKKEASREPAKH
jgi:hypothetical protein